MRRGQVASAAELFNRKPGGFSPFAIDFPAMLIKCVVDCFPNRLAKQPFLKEVNGRPYRFPFLATSIKRLHENLNGHIRGFPTFEDFLLYWIEIGPTWNQLELNSSIALNLLAKQFKANLQLVKANKRWVFMAMNIALSIGTRQI